VVTSGHLRPESGSLPDDAVFIPKPYGEKAPVAVIQSLLS